VRRSFPTIAKILLTIPLSTLAFILSGCGVTACHEVNLVDYSSGFTSSGLSLTGSSTLSGGVLQLTNGRQFESSTAWAEQVPVWSFTSDFTFQLINPVADGITFTIQNTGGRAIGAYGRGLGYQGIGKSVAIKFDLWNNEGEGINSTGVYLNGAMPSVPAIDLTGTGIDLHSGHVMQVHVEYSSSTLSFTITDTTTNAAVTETATVDIPTIVGGDYAFVGFTGGTGGSTATQDILTWTYTFINQGSQQTCQATSK
jgi:hypothetical protein